MGDRTAEVLKLTMIIIACVAVMALSFSVFAITKSQANSEANNLIYQIDAFNNMDFDALDNEIINGSMVKSTINNMKSKDVAMIVVTNSLLATQLSEFGMTDEATLSGYLVDDIAYNKVPFVVLENNSLETLQGTYLETPVAVNYGSVLKNSVLGLQSDGMHPESILTDSGFEFSKYDDTTEFAQTIKYEDGYFKTKLDFLSNDSDRIVRYDMSGDFNTKGTTMYINDASMFNSYLLKDVAKNTIGVVFIQLN